MEPNYNLTYPIGSKEAKILSNPGERKEKTTAQGLKIFNTQKVVLNGSLVFLLSLNVEQRASR
jgi:hypothetical protein